VGERQTQKEKKRDFGGLIITQVRAGIGPTANKRTKFGLGKKKTPEKSEKKGGNTKKFFLNGGELVKGER